MSPVHPHISPDRQAEYWHEVHGRVLIIGSHPHDGALLICETSSSAEDYESAYIDCERDELKALPDRMWPWLGHCRPNPLEAA